MQLKMEIKKLIDNNEIDGRFDDHHDNGSMHEMLGKFVTSPIQHSALMPADFIVNSSRYCGSPRVAVRHIPFSRERHSTHVKFPRSFSLFSSLMIAQEYDLPILWHLMDRSIGISIVVMDIG